MKPQDDVKPDEGQSASTGGLGLPVPCSKFHFCRDWACYAWSVSVGQYQSPYLNMRGGSVCESKDGYKACWRWMGAA